MSDAWSVVRKERYNNTKVWREIRRVLQEEDVVCPFNRMREKEKREHWKVLKEKRKGKVSFLFQKYGHRERMDCMTEVQGITVGDQTIPGPFSSDTQSYGDVVLTDEEKRTLCLPPKFVVCDRVDLTSCEAQIEKGLAK